MTIAGAVSIVKVKLLSVWLFTITKPVTDMIEEENLSVRHFIYVGVEEITWQGVPSDRVILIVLPSTKEGGKLVPLIVKILSPIGLSSI